jgi:hypothetical protein
VVSQFLRKWTNSSNFRCCSLPRRLSSLARSAPPRVPSSSRRSRPWPAPALVPGPSASALTCRQRPLACRRRRAGSCPWPVCVRPRLPPSSSRRLSSLARRRPPSPAVSAPSRAGVVAPALVPSLSASILACRRHCRRRRHRRRRMRPTDHRRPAAAQAFAVLSASSSLGTKLIVAIAIICSQCFVETGDTVGNPAATKTGDTVTCHRAATSRREALPGAWEAGVYLTAGAEANHQSLHGRYVGTLSRKRR